MVQTILIALATIAVLVGAFLLLRKWLNWGPQEIPCAHFHDHVHHAAPSRFIRDIQRDALIDHHDEEPDPMAAEFKEIVTRSAAPALKSAPRPEAEFAAESEREKVLMLSGGGQWGAYGAGLFKTLHDRSGDGLAMKNVRIITGISTGSLQTILLMVALDGKAKEETRRYAMERLEWGYSPLKESDVVDNRGMAQMLLRGAVAGTGPLRKRIRNAIYENGDATMLEAIRDSSIAGYIGFVEAHCGLFHYVDVRGLVRDAPNWETAVDALCAATMASSAMPVFHQQLRVTKSGNGDRSLYDGGVRRSVFFERAMEAMHDEVRRQAGDPGDNNPPGHEQEEVTPDFFVVRNGPTVRQPDPDLDANDGPLANGQRGYDLLVNEAEIGAIANLRLLNPHGRIWVTTADGYDAFDCKCKDADCSKESEMFKPGFMACLRDLGRHKVERDGGPWWEMATLDARSVAERHRHQHA